MEKGLHLSFAFDAPQSTATLKTQQRASKYNGKLTTDPNPEVKRGEALAYYIRERFASNPKQAYKLLLDAYRLHMHYETYSAENSRLVGIIVTLEDLFFSAQERQSSAGKDTKRKDIIYHEEQTITCDGCGAKPEILLGTRVQSDAPRRACFDRQQVLLDLLPLVHGEHAVRRHRY
jgi:hypothetical protein